MADPQGLLDMKIVGGRIVDGTGAPSFVGDVGIRDGRIVAIGQISEDAVETIDATGLVVSPGFIDAHTHYDAQIFWDPALSPSCFHGVTTILGGFCGFSIAPLTPESATFILPMLARVEGMPVKTLELGVPWDWTSFGSYLDKLEGKAGLNVGFFAGHSAIRRIVMGERATGSEATAAEIDAMAEMLDRSLSEGALGFSTTKAPGHNDADGNPVPSRFASREEMLRLAAVCKKHEGTSLELLPDLAFDQETIDLMTDFSLAGERTVNWNVLAVYGSDEEAREKVKIQLDVSDYARERGGHVLALTVPSTPNIQFNLHSGFIFDSIPDWEWLFKITPEERMKALRDPAKREILRAGTMRLPVYLNMFDWSNMLVAETFSVENEEYRGRMVGEIAATGGRDPVDVLFDLALADELKTSFMPQRGGEDHACYALRGELWRDDRTLVGASDAGAHMDMIDTFAFSTRVLEKGVRIHKVISLEEAVRQLSSVPADCMGLRDRGTLAPGKMADITIFDLNTIACGPTYTRHDLPGEELRLYADAKGISHVLVNATVVVRHGEHTGAMPGTVMRSGRDTYTVPLPPRPAA